MNRPERPEPSVRPARHRGVRAAGAVAVAVLALAACGSSKSTTKKATTTTTVKGGTTTTRPGTVTTPAPTLAPVTTAATIPPTPAPAPTTPTTVAYKPESTTGALVKGVKGTRTAAMQQKLKALGYDPGPADGIFGEKTETAVKRFQTDQKLTVDGQAGTQTLNALDKACKAKNAC